MEAQLYRLESQVEIARANTADNTSDIRTLRREIDRLAKRVDQLETELYRLRMARLNTWVLVIYFVITVALLATLARGFGGSD